LAELAPGARGVLVTVGLQDPENLERLRRLGLLPGVKVELVEANDRGFSVRVDDEQRWVPAGLARELWIKGA
jgi:Fe2+ transport system protein FeoA